MTLYSENIIMEKPLIEIEYCTKCRWLSRASWIAQELLSSFPSEIGGITLIPSDIAGNFACPLVVEMLRRTGERRLAKFLHSIYY